MRGFYIGLTPAAAWKNNSKASIFVAAATVCGAELDPPLLIVCGALNAMTGGCEDDSLIAEATVVLSLDKVFPVIGGCDIPKAANIPFL